MDAAGRVLITRRALNSHQGGLWEFPGGKVEPGESLGAALARELREELDIDIDGSSPLLQVMHDYADKAVLLDVHIVRRFRGHARGVENQPLAWVAPDALQGYDFPAANGPIVRAIEELYASTGGQITGS
jgi:8-oxo-dGTP diphosphatase